MFAIFTCHKREELTHGVEYIIVIHAVAWLQCVVGASLSHLHIGAVRVFVFSVRFLFMYWDLETKTCTYCV